MPEFTPIDDMVAAVSDMQQTWAQHPYRSFVLRTEPWGPIVATEEGLWPPSPVRVIELLCEAVASSIEASSHLQGPR